MKNHDFGLTGDMVTQQTLLTWEQFDSEFSRALSTDAGKVGGQ